MMEQNEKWMRRCLQLAACGETGAPPNPMVGAVIVCDGRIIGEGFHVCCGKAHAEVNALNSVRPADRGLLSRSTLYVSLEPCSHYGRTPPCAELIIRTGIPRVVVGCLDPFAKVSGRGVRMLREAGIEVTVGVLENECRALNRRFFTFHLFRRPFVTLKWAASADGFIDRWREAGRPGAACPPLYVPQPDACPSSAFAPRCDTGGACHASAGPSLAHGAPLAGSSPLRIVLGRVAEGELPAGFEAFADIDTMLSSLHRRGVQSLLVEGGQQTLQAFIDSGLWDEAWEELSAVRLGSGVPAPRMPVGVLKETETFFEVSLTHWINETVSGEGDPVVEKP